ncbi:MAG: GGDEF domain-containing protein [Methylobacteriaceae bacterium]|nr:GGDEF domain-containing protein [Methylobacteriaceae bacterium]
MSFDPATLMTLTALTAATVGALLVFAWAQNRSHRALAMWGGADLGGAVATALLMTRNHTPDFVSITLPFGIIAVTYAVIWAAGRAFADRPLQPTWMAAGALVWLLACASPAFFASTQARVTLISAIGATYMLATACELWRDRGEHLPSRYPIVGCLVLHAGLLLARAGVAAVWTLPQGSEVLMTPWVALMSIEPTIMVIAGGFLQLSLAKERSELVQRRAAATDELTGVASRRAFLEEGERRLNAALRQGLPAALLLLDLDHFKQINDSHGHHMGDRVLQAFARRAVEILRPGDLFGRVGGEEFGALLSNTGPEAALRVAERLRQAVEDLDFSEGDVELRLSVSVGVATASGPSCDFGDLLRQADHALYGAKSAGRNCVQQRKLHAAPLLRAV